MTLVGCKLDDNLSPNNPTADILTPDLRLAAAENEAYRAQGAADFARLGGAWTNAWAGNTVQFGDAFTTEQNLEITATFDQDIFNNAYTQTAGAQEIITLPNATTDYPNYVAAAKILKAYYLEPLVDLYGDVPYSEAFQGAANTTPKYDKDTDVYAALINELTSALQLLQTDHGQHPIIGSSDPMFNGDLSKWTAFANTVLLKYAIHLSTSSDPAAKTMLQSIGKVISPSSQFLSSDVTLNPGYNNSATNTMNPLYASVGRLFNSGTLNTQSYHLQCASAHIVNLMTGNLDNTDSNSQTNNITAGIFDPRISKLFTTAVSIDPTITTPVYFGLNQGQKLPIKANNVSELGGSFFDPTGSAPINATLSAYIMPEAESDLLQAEASVQGILGFSSANAPALFHKAIMDSFEFEYNRTQPSDPDAYIADAQSYLGQINGKPKLDITGNKANDLYAIQYQRWITLTNYNGIETYIDFLRLGYPSNPMALTTTETNRPFRLMYPASELSRNASNVPTVTVADCFNRSAASTPFIYK